MQQITAPSKGCAVRSARGTLICFLGTGRADLTFLAIAAHNGLPEASFDPMWKQTAAALRRMSGRTRVHHDGFRSSKSRELGVAFCISSLGGSYLRQDLPSHTLEMARATAGSEPMDMVPARDISCYR